MVAFLSGVCAELAAVPKPVSEPPKPIVLLVGGPGSGRSVQGAPLAAALGLTRLTEDDLLQDELARQTAETTRAKQRSGGQLAGGAGLQSALCSVLEDSVP